MKLSQRASEVFPKGENIDMGALAKLLPTWSGSDEGIRCSSDDESVLMQVRSELRRKSLMVSREDGYTIISAKILPENVESFFENVSFERHYAETLAYALKQENPEARYTVRKLR